MSAAEILPCPFCGGEEFETNGFSGRWYVDCLDGNRVDCTYLGPHRETESEAITAHNRLAGAAGLLAEARGYIRRRVSVGSTLLSPAENAEAYELLARIDALGGGK